MASATIISPNTQKAKRINAVDYPQVSIKQFTRTVKINEVLPFRVKFTTIGIAPFGSNVPGIGLQIIGTNNYIL